MHLKFLKQYSDGLVQEKRNSSALAKELCLSCTNPLIWAFQFVVKMKLKGPNMVWERNPALPYNDVI